MADAARSTGSLPVANVQALVATCNNGVDEQEPERYLSKDPNAEEVVASDDSTCAIPVIDLHKLLDPEPSEEECAKLGFACLNWGFFQEYICILVNMLVRCNGIVIHYITGGTNIVV
jgi:hypothetical protein